MKIVCGSCQAKYSIADEKVAGKVFKIRCKRCSEVIVVRGDQDAPADAGNGNYAAAGNGSHAADEPTSVDAIWHVVVNGEQAGPYSPSQLADLLRGGQVDWEAYVWCEGFENWLPMRDVPDLVSGISGQPAQAVPAAAQPAAAAPSMGADPFADEGGAAGVGMFAQPAPAAAARSNLFGDVQSVPFDTSPKMVASAPSPRVSADQAMTGARNENSVLFSLKNLQALATGTSTPAPPSGVPTRPGYAGGEGSGLIDIRALASATGVADQAREESEKDALLSLGSAQGGAFGALGSPMLAPGKSEDEGNKKGLMVAIIAGFALLAGAVVAIAFILKPNAPAPAAGVVAPMVAPPSAANGPGPNTELTALNPNAPKQPVEPPSEGELAAQRAAQAAAQQPSATERVRPSGSAPRHSAAEKPAEPPAAAKTEPIKPAAAPAEKPKSKGGSSLDDLLDSAIGSKGGGAAKAEAAAANLPEKPTREDVLDAMNGVKDPVKACAKGAGGVAFANVTVIGKTGRVANVEVTGITGDVGSCIARTVRGAKFPKFKAENFQVKFPFRL
jgi:predicted Zn finger-like uncharacterized protein